MSSSELTQHHLQKFDRDAINVDARMPRAADVILQIRSDLPNSKLIIVARRPHQHGSGDLVVLDRKQGLKYLTAALGCIVVDDSEASVRPILVANCRESSRTGLIESIEHLEHSVLTAGGCEGVGKRCATEPQLPMALVDLEMSRGGGQDPTVVSPQAAGLLCSPRQTRSPVPPPLFPSSSPFRGLAHRPDYRPEVHHIVPIYPVPLRCVRCHSAEIDTYYVFITNNSSAAAQTIADIFRQSWTVELFFDWFNQPLRVKRILGNSPNAVKMQIWIAGAVYILNATRQRLLKHSLYTMLQVFSTGILVDFATKMAKTWPSFQTN